MILNGTFTQGELITIFGIIISSIIGICAIIVANKNKKNRINKKKINYKISNIRNNIKSSLEEYLNNSHITNDVINSGIFPEILFNNKKYSNITEILDENHLHYEIVGVGGGGKTISLLYIANYYYKKKKTIAFFIDLKNTNNEENIISIKEQYFTKKYILEYYLNIENIIIDKRNCEKLFSNLIDILKKNKIKVYLLLDGFNELDKGRDNIIIELNKILDGNDVKCIITCRYDIREIISKDFNKITLNDFSENTIKLLCKNNNINYENINDRLISVIKNPLMFTIYKKIMLRNENEIICDENINSQTSLLDFYFSYNKKLNINEINMNYVCISLILPYIAHKIEKCSKYETSENDIIGIITYIVDKIFNDKMYRNKNRKVLDFYNKEFNNNLDVIYGSLIKYIYEKSGMLIIEKKYNKDYYYFPHQIYRDYFSSKYIYDEIIDEKKIYESDLIIRKFPLYISEFIAEMFYEYDAIYKWKKNNYNEFLLNNSRLSKILEYFTIDKCRELSINSSLAIENILNMINIARDGLYCLKLENIDLTEYLFNGKYISRHINNRIISSEIKNCIIDYNKFIPQGHYQWVYGVVIFNDYIISCGRDGFVKFWEDSKEYCLYSIKLCDTGIRFILSLYIKNEIFIVCFDEDDYLYTINPITKKSNKIIKLENKICNVKYYPEKKDNIFISNDKGKLEKIIFIDENNIKIVSYNIPHSIYVNNFCIKNNTEIIACTPKGNILNVNLNSCVIEDIKKEESGMINDIILSMREYLLYYTCQRGIIKYDMINKTEERYDFQNNNILNKIIPQKICLNNDKTKILAAYNNKVFEWTINPQKYIVKGEHDNIIEDICYFNNDKKYISVSRDFSLRINNLESNKKEYEFKGNSFWIKRFVIDEKNNILYLPNNDSTIKKYNIKMNTHIDFIEGHKERIYSIDIFLKKNIIVSASLDKRVGVWDAEEWKNIAFSEEKEDIMDDVVVIDDIQFATIDSSNNVYLWELYNNRINCKSIINMSEVNDNINKAVGSNSINFLKNINVLASTHWDGTIHLWHYNTGKLELFKKLHDAKCWQYCIKEYIINEHYVLITCGNDGIIRIYSLDSNYKNIILKCCYDFSSEGSIYQFDNINEYIYFSTSKGSIIIIDSSTINLSTGKLKSNKPSNKVIDKIHDGRIFAIKSCHELSHIYTYSEDGYINISKVNGYDITLERKIKNVAGIFIKNVVMDDSNITANNSEINKKLVYGYV